VTKTLIAPLSANSWPVSGSSREGPAKKTMHGRLMQLTRPPHGYEDHLPT